MELQYLSFLKPYKNLLGVINGVNTQDIELMKKKYNVQLPVAYKEYLLLFGGKCGNFLNSYLMTYGNIERNFKTVIFDLENTVHNNSFTLNPNIFFFGQWQGTTFYFICDGNDNPAIYFLEDFDNIFVYKDSFTQFIFEEGLKPLLDNSSHK